jgi:alkylhydroperoxidase family enzyme
MSRLPDPDPQTIPANVEDFLTQFPPDAMFKMLTHSVSTVQPFIGLAQAIYTSLQLPIRTREVVILTVADAVECDFVFTQHIPISEAAGVDQDLRRLIRRRDHANPTMSEPDRTIVQFATEVVTQPRVSDATFAAARALLTAREVVELLHVCGYYWTFSRICTTLDVDLTQLYAELPQTGWSTTP